jgi:hypothetical protein
MKSFIIFIFLILFINEMTCIKLKEDDYVEVNRQPKLDIRIEQPDNDPINFERFKEDRKFYIQKVNNMLQKYENDKNSLKDVINAQNNMLQKLSDDAIEIYNAASKIIKQDKN